MAECVQRTLNFALFSIPSETFLAHCLYPQEKLKDTQILPDLFLKPCESGTELNPH